MNNRGNNFKHGHAQKYKHTKTYNAWISINQRCNNPNRKDYKYYGDIGIRVCYRWSNKNSNGFKNFLKDVGKIPKEKYLVRINNKDNYSPKNYKLIPKEYPKNRKNNIKIKFNGRWILLIELARKYKIYPQALKTRLKLKWPLKEALIRPIRKRKSVLISDYEKQLRSALWYLKLKKNNKIIYSKDLPYSNKQLYNHLEKIKISQNNCCPMCNKSYIKIKYDIDHIIPTSAAKTRNQLLKLFYLKNLSLLCYKCNRWIKKDKIIKDN